MNYLLNKLIKHKWIYLWMPRLLVLLIPTVWLLIAFYFRLLISAEVVVSLLIITLIGSLASLKAYNGGRSQRPAGQITLALAVLFSSVIPLIFLLAQVNWRGPAASPPSNKSALPAAPRPNLLAPVLAEVRTSLKIFRELPSSMEVTYPAVHHPQKVPILHTDVSLVGLTGSQVAIGWPGGPQGFIIRHRLLANSLVGNEVVSPSNWLEIGTNTVFNVQPNASVVSLLAQYGRSYSEQTVTVETRFPPGYEGIRTFKQTDTTGDWLWGKLPPRTLSWTASLHLRDADGAPLIGKLPPVWTLDRLPRPGKLAKTSYPWPANGVLHLESSDVPVGQDFLVLSTDGPWKMFVTLKLKR